MAVWTHIAHSALSLPAATVTWTGISGSYDHLCIKVSARSAISGIEDFIEPTFNNDTASNYSGTELYAASSTVAAGQQTGLSHAYYLSCAGNTAMTDAFGAMTIWIPHYANSANFKQVLVEAATENNSASNNQWKLQVTAALWSATAAITEIDLSVCSGNDFMAYSTFDLYGITGA